MFFSVGFLWRCANIYAPQGGPRDTLPPKVVLMRPANNTTNFNGKRLYVEFDEYVKIKDQQKEFYTSPIMKTKPLLTIRNKGIQIDIKDTLEPNTTYSFNFGNSVTDNNEGNVLPGFRYVFSTGESVDSMVMSGYCADGRTKDTLSQAFIFFYDAVKDTIKNNKDSILLLRKPDVVGRAETNGIFIAQNLKPIDYRVYAFKDENNNMQYDPGVDMVAFSDSLFNPLKLPDFAMWLDTMRHYYVADPQIYMKLFMDKGYVRQSLNESKRPFQRKIELQFTDANPQISELVLEGIDTTNMIFEYPTKRRDTIYIWLTQPAEELPDTIKGKITYMKHDSVRQLSPVTENLSLLWKLYEKKKSKREEREAKENYVNPFKYNTSVSGSHNPNENIDMTFDYPIVEFDSSKISLIRSDDQGRKFRVKTLLARDSVELRKWTIKAPLIENSNYNLVIADSVIKNINGESNDSIKISFSTLDPEKLGSFVITVKGKSDDSQYIVELLSGGKEVERLKHVKSGKYKFKYVPLGAASIRITEDINGNGEWDGGSLIDHIQPERVEVFMLPSGETDIEVKANWELELDLDMEKIFAPETMQSIIDMLHQREVANVRKRLKELEKGKIGAKPKRERVTYDQNDVTQDPRRGGRQEGTQQNRTQQNRMQQR